MGDLQGHPLWGWILYIIGKVYKKKIILSLKKNTHLDEAGQKK